MDIRRRLQIGGIKKTSSGGGSTVGSYTVNLNGQWEATTAVSNPDSSLYDGVYRSSSNYNVNNGVATMYITIKDCSSFRLYIRSYAESSYDYVMVSQLDKTITGNSSYSDTTLVKAHTSGNQQSGTALSNYTLVEFTGISAGEHTITVVYRKDGSVNSGDDRGYVLIEKSQAGNDGEDEGGSSKESNYLTIEAKENGLTASLSVNACEYCVDGDGNWKTLSAGTATESINVGQTLSFRGELTPTSSAGIGTFTISKKCNILGNCMSMLFGNNASSNFSLSGKSYAFYKLFYNCTNIITVSNNFLPATTLANNCYYYMFYSCRSLTTAPELPATTLASNCYRYMFNKCSSLTAAPELPATTLSSNCYSDMFCECSSLTTAPELPATTLADHCYSSMFYYCSNLTTAPELPATALADYCYNSMFRDCTSLTTAPSILPATTLADYCYNYMFSECTALTAAPELPATALAPSCYGHMFYGCSSLTTAPELPATTLTDNCYYYMFDGCSSLTTAPELPATTLTKYCYYHMFYGCSSLTTAPELPATIIAYRCYEYMFSGCNALTTAPMLPATTLTNECYREMFRGCTSLTAAPKLPATTLADYCYYSMFYDCKSLTTAPKLPATTLKNYCYYGMFYNCTSLTTAPELPSTTLADYCYNSMFRNCSKLNYIKMLATDISAKYCLSNWVNNISKTGTLVKHPNMKTLPTGENGIPRGWTVVNDGEESGGNLITFTIDGTEYQAEEGMTWGEFVASEYNTVNELGDKYVRNADGIIQYAHVYYENSPDGMYYWTEYRDIFKNYMSASTYVFSDEYIREDINYIYR